MPNFTDLTGLASVASAIAASLLLLPWITRRTQSHLAMLLGALFLLVLIPFSGMPLAAYMRGVTGDLSITTLLLLGCALLKPGGGVAQCNNRFPLLILIALAALVLYPMALGVGAYDPYRWGYGNPQFLAVLLLLALFACLRKSPLIALCIAFAIIAWAVGWYESDNLWDYLLDPFLSIYALAVIIIWGMKTLLRGQRDRT